VNSFSERIKLRKDFSLSVEYISELDPERCCFSGAKHQHITLGYHGEQFMKVDFSPY
jgi:hypothetical protein